MNNAERTDADASEPGAREGVVPGFLEIYLQDHFAGSTGGLELAQKAAEGNADTEFGPPLTRIAQEIEEDRETLREAMEGIGVGTDKLKMAGAWIGEKALRLKTGAHELSSPALNPLVEIETLIMGVTGKRELWRTLQALTPQVPQLESFGVESLIERVDDQLERLESLRLRAVHYAYETEAAEA